MKASSKNLGSRRKERAKFAGKLVSAMMEGRKMLFADETSYQVTSCRRLRRTWQDPEQPILTTVNTQGLKSTTVYGACSNFDLPLQFQIYSTTNTDGWVNFLWQLNEELKKRHVRGKVLLIVDGHRAHFTDRSIAHLGKLQLFQLPAYSK